MRRSPGYADCDMARAIDAHENRNERLVARFIAEVDKAIASQVVGDDIDCVGEHWSPEMCRVRLHVLQMARRGEINLEKARWFPRVVKESA